MPEGLEFVCASLMTIVFVIVMGIMIFIYQVLKKTERNEKGKEKWDWKSILISIIIMILGAIVVFFAVFIPVYIING